MMMHDTVYNYEVGADDLFVGDDQAARVIADPRVEAAVEAIEDASTLDELADALNAELAPDVEEQVYERVDMTSLPTFGGDEPESGTAGVWSWDERRVLVGDSAPFEIVSRREWEARGE